jgi:hypothetical protein
MELVPLAEMTLRYTSLQSLDFGPGGQLYGVMEGRIDGDRLSGDVHLTNLAARRPDDVNMPMLRGVVTTNDGTSVWIELDSIATLREADAARVFVTSCRFRTGDARHAWLNRCQAVVEGVLDEVRVGGLARALIHECRPTLGAERIASPSNVGRPGDVSPGA